MNGSVYIKMLLLTLATVVTVTFCSIVYFDRTMSEFEDGQNEIRAKELANTAIVYLDMDAIKSLKEKVSAAYQAAENPVGNDQMGTVEYADYMRQFDELKLLPEYEKLYTTLRGLEEVTSVDSLYLAYLDERTRAAVFLVDAGDNNTCYPGSFDKIGGAEDIVSDPQHAMTSAVTNPDTYGNIVGYAQEIKDADGKTVAYLCVDISMSNVDSQRRRLLFNAALSMTVIVLLLSVAVFFLSRRIFAKPLTEHEELVKESENLRRENRSLVSRAKGNKRIMEMAESISSLLSYMPAMTFSKDVVTGRYLACNQQFAEYAHKESPTQVIGHTDEELFDAKTARHFREDDKAAMEMDDPYIFNEDTLDGEGNLHHLQTTKLRFMDEVGRLCVLGMSVDFSEMYMVKKENAETKKAYQRLKALSDRFIVIYAINPATNRFEECTSFRGIETVALPKSGVDFFERFRVKGVQLICEEDRQRIESALDKGTLLKTIREEGRFETGFRMLVDGSPKPVNLRATMIEEEDGTRLIVGLREIPAEKAEAGG